MPCYGILGVKMQLSPVNKMNFVSEIAVNNQLEL